MSRYFTWVPNWLVWANPIYNINRFVLQELGRFWWCVLKKMGGMYNLCCLKSLGVIMNLFFYNKTGMLFNGLGRPLNLKEPYATLPPRFEEKLQELNSIWTLFTLAEESSQRKTGNSLSHGIKMTL